uniref:CREB regulated transcription coactivator 2 n=1 Tax=Terrapene triunguis TaxID=2587831 RepID=A0A674JL51_9SAUR
MAQRQESGPGGVPLDTSKLPADQRLPPYPYNQPGLLMQSQQPLQQTQRSPFGPGIPAPGAGSAHGAAAGALHLGESLSPPPRVSLQLEQFSMGESPPGSFPLNHNTFPDDLGALNYHSAESLGFSASGSNFHDPHLLSRQNLSNCSRHGPIPNIVLTGDSPPGISKEIASALAGVPGFEVDTSLGLEEDLKIEPLTLDGLSMLSDPYALLTDPAVEDSFRTDRLQ